MKKILALLLVLTSLVLSLASCARERHELLAVLGVRDLPVFALHDLRALGDPGQEAVFVHLADAARDRTVLGDGLR